MKKLLTLFFLPLLVFAQQNVRQNIGDKKILDHLVFSTKTLTIAADGTFVWTNGGTFTGAADFRTAIGAGVPGEAVWGSITGTLSAQTDLNTALGLKAPLASPTFTGVPAAPTAAADTNTTQIATTAFAKTEADAAQSAAALDATAKADAAQAAAAIDATTKANAAQAFAIQRANHTGTQAVGTITGLAASATTDTTDASNISAGTLPAGRMPALTGDVSTTVGNVATVLATVNNDVGAFGSSTTIPTLTVNGKGLVTAVSTNAVIAPAGTLTGNTLNSTVTASSLTSLGTLTTLGLNGYQDFTEIAAPSNPGSTSIRVWADLDSTFGHLNFKDTNGLTYQLARDNIHTVRNTTGSTISKGKWVYISGSTGDVPNVALARADSANTTPAFGLVVADITNNSFGQVMTGGDAQGINTSGFAAGDVLYLSASSAGDATATRQTGINQDQRLGVVIRSNAGNGIVGVLIGGDFDPSTTQTMANKTFIAPALGTPVSGVATNLTGTAAGLTAGNVTTNANLTGDVTSVGNATLLATVASAGTTGSSTAIPVVTINAKGLTTGITTAAVIAPAGTLTGTTLAANVVNSSLTTLGTIGTGVWQGTAIADTYLAALSASKLTGTTLPASIVTSSLATVGALNSGSITSGFGSIDVGADSISGGAGTFSGDSVLTGTTGTGGNGYLSGPSVAGKYLNIRSGNTTGGIAFRDSLYNEVASYTQSTGAWVFTGNTSITGTLGATGDISTSSSSAGSTKTLSVVNSSNTASSSSRLFASVAGSSAGDAYTEYLVAGTTAWSVGVDNSDGDYFKIAQSSNLGTSDRFVLDTSGNVAIGGATATKRLHLYSADALVGATQLNLQGTVGAYGAGITFTAYLAATTTLQEMARITADGEAPWNTTSSTQDAGLRFYTSLDGSVTEKMRILAEGTLYLYGGNASFGGVASSGVNKQIDLLSYGATLNILANGTSGANGVTYNTSFANGGAGPHIFKVGGTEALRVASGAVSVTGTGTFSSDINIAGTSTQLKFTDTTTEHYITTNNGENFLGISQAGAFVRIAAGNSQVAQFNAGAVLFNGYVSSGTYQADPATGTTDSVSINNAGWTFWSRDAFPSLFIRRRSSDGNIAQFYRDTTNVGSISVTTTATAYNTSSDARLKNSITEVDHAKVRNIVNDIRIRDYLWNANNKAGLGPIAQELAAVHPLLVEIGAVTPGDGQQVDYAAWRARKARVDARADRNEQVKKVHKLAVEAHGKEVQRITKLNEEAAKELPKADPEAINGTVTFNMAKAVVLKTPEAPAEPVLESDPEDNEKDFVQWQVDLSKLTPFLIDYAQQESKRLDKLEARILALEAK